LEHVKTRLFAVVLCVSGISVYAQSLGVTNDLQLWLRADAGVTTNAAGGVLGWSDQSTNANNALQPADTQAPTWTAAVLNNRPVLRFDGIDDFLDVADSPSLSITNDISTFFVIRFDDFATYRAVWGKTAGNDGNLPAPTDIYALPGTGVLRAFRGDGTLANLTSADSAALPANTPLVIGFDVAGDTLTHYLNNQPNGSGLVTLITADGNTGLKIGTRQDQFTRMKGDIAELLIYSRALSSVERTNVFNYLQVKYNLLNLLPTIVLSSDAAGANVNVGQVVTLTASAADLDGTITRVDFFSGTSIIGTATRPPYTLRVALDSAGPASFSARATDDKSGTATSSTITLTATTTGPMDLPVTTGLQLWLKAGAGTTVGGAGGVLLWADQSSAANNAAQIDENMAPVLTNGAVNGHPALRFDGVNDFLEIPDSDSLSITNDITSLFVIKFADFATFRAVWGKTAGAGGNIPAPTDLYALPNDNRLRVFRGNGVANGSVTATQPFVANTFLQAGFDVAGTAMRLYYNGLPNGNGTISVAAADANGTLRIGTRADLVTRLRGELAELVIFDRALTAPERRSVERYLAEKYALPTLVSTIHTAPIVSITQPAGQVVQAPGTVTVAANANDPDGSIVSVQFLANNASIGTDPVAPYSTNLSLTYGGRVTVAAIATDNFGVQTRSAPVEVCIQGPAAPVGLVGYWPLNGDAIAAFGTSGTMVSNPVPTMDRNGVAGSALYFDGTLQQRVQIPGGGGLNNIQRGSISMWVKWVGTQDTGFGGTAGAVLSRQQDGSFSAHVISLNSADPNAAVLQWRQSSAGTVNATGTAQVGSDTWRHIAITFTESNSIIYLDGFPEVTGTGGGAFNNANTPLAIGAWPGGGGSFATAAIDDVATWNRVLSLEEVQLLAGQERTPLTLLVAPDCLSMERSPAAVILRWGSGAVLQTASEANGPYFDLSGETSPYNSPSDDPRSFFRLRSP
jgi:hypothetical protein